jgi:hypothetical protein
MGTERYLNIKATEGIRTAQDFITHSQYNIGFTWFGSKKTAKETFEQHELSA